MNIQAKLEESIDNPGKEGKTSREIAPGTRTRSRLARAVSLGIASAALVVAGCAGDLEGDNFPNAVTGGAPAGGAGGTAGTTTGGAPAGGSTGVGVPPDPCVTQVFTASCSGPCHNTAAAAFFGNLDLSTADIGTRLADAPASNRTAPCAADGKIINTADPSQSVLIQRIKGTQPAGCGTPMPMPPSPPLSATDQACIETWLNKF